MAAKAVGAMLLLLTSYLLMAMWCWQCHQFGYVIGAGDDINF